MCGILGFYSDKELAMDLRGAFSKIEHRGDDAYGLAVDGTTRIVRRLSSFKKVLSNVSGRKILVHNLHNVVGFRPQPIDGRFAANCEIYNWKSLNTKYRLKAKNDAELLFKLLEKFGVNKTLDLLDGDYAFCYEKKGKLYLARDIIGVKPLVYGFKKGIFYFASEKKALDELGLKSDFVKPDEIVIFDGKKVSKKKRKFYSLPKKSKLSEGQLLRELHHKFTDAVSKRIDDVDKVGILFSGGIDSTLLALFSKVKKKKVICYTCAFKDKTIRDPQDALWAKRIAKDYDLKLKIKYLGYKNIEKHLKEVIKITETTDVIKVGVAAPFLAASRMAKKDRIKVMLSGLGSEEIFAGYQRHLDVLNKKGDVNKECVNGLKKMWDRDLYRDDLVMMSNGIELRLPFLDKDLIDFALKIPSKYKITKDQKKIILRKLALVWGLHEEYAFRPKLAAQYGSNFDKAIEKLTKRNGFKYKKDYLMSLI